MKITATRHDNRVTASAQWPGQDRPAVLSAPLSVFLGAWRWAREAKTADESAERCTWRTLQTLASRESDGCYWITPPQTAAEKLAADLRDNPGSADMFAAELARRTK